MIDTLIPNAYYDALNHFISKFQLKIDKIKIVYFCKKKN